MPLRNIKALSFSFANRQKTTGSTVCHLIEENRTLQDNPKIIAEIPQKQYCQVFSNSDTANLDCISDIILSNTITDISFDASDILEAIKEIKYHSAVGPYRFHARVLEALQQKCVSPLANVRRHSMYFGYIKETLHSQSDVPVSKMGNKSLALNYRPIPLTSHTMNAFERVVRSQITGFLEENNLLNHKQNGVRNGSYYLM